MRVYHTATKCSGLDQYSVGVLGSNSMVIFICEDCRQCNECVTKMPNLFQSADAAVENVKSNQVENENMYQQNAGIQSELQKISPKC